MEFEIAEANVSEVQPIDLTCAGQSHKAIAKKYKQLVMEELAKGKTFQEACKSARIIIEKEILEAEQTQGMANE